MKTRLKLFFTAGFILVSIFSFAQTKFENKKLSLLSYIFYNTTRENINYFMMESGFKKSGVENVNEDDLNEIHSFNSQFENIEVHYNKDNKTLGVYCAYDGAPNNVFIEMELKDMGYIAKIVEKEIEDEIVQKTVWNKTGSNIRFATISNEEEKMGMLAIEITKND